MTAEVGHEMTSKQLDDLWHFDFKLAHELLGLPLRKCTALSEGTWGKPMGDADFDRLKMQVRRMWLRAALLFTCFQNEDGWGLKVNDQCEKHVCLTDNSFTVLGWLAAAPSVSQCPTGHRYLRSPIGKTLYLGGPISLANWSRNPTVRCIASVSKNSLHKSSFYVSTVGPLSVGTAITWDYGSAAKHPLLHPVQNWQIAACCRVTCNVFKPHSASSSRKVAARHTSKRLRLVQAYRLCTYCGINIETSSGNYDPTKPPTKKNMKPHIALNHAVQICSDQGLEFDSETNGVPHESFLSQLHLVNKVLASLESHNYVVLPACHIFEALCREPLPDDATHHDEEKFFSDFLCEAREAFRKYRVVYLKGITIPSCYKDLLAVCQTSYADVSWEGVKPPRSNTFSIKQLLSDEQMQALAREVQVTLENIVKSYTDV